MSDFWQKIKLGFYVFLIGVRRRWDSFRYTFKDETLVGQSYYVMTDPQTGKRKIVAELITKEDLANQQKTLLENTTVDDAIEEGICNHFIDHLEEEFSIKVEVGSVKPIENYGKENISR